MREQRRLAAIVSADVAGYSRLMGRDESGTVARLRHVRTERLQPVLDRRGGRIVKLTGDGALIEFGSAVEALSAAIEFQQAMAEGEAERPEAERLVFRVGVHLGDVIVDGEDLYGDGVNVAARLEGEAPPGGVVISGDMHNFAAGRVAATFDDLGRLSLKNIERPVQAYAVRWQANDWPRASSVASLPVTPAPAPFAPDTPLPLPDKPSIAVLPFQNMSGDPEQEYFADGMVEDIITALSRFKSLFVIARNSSFNYKGKSPDLRDVGRDLGVRYVLEGSVRKAGQRIRITAQLIEVAAASHVWADRFEGTTKDVFELQDDIVSKVVGRLTPNLERAEIERTARKPTERLDAYDSYLRGLASLHTWTRAGNDVALRNFLQAIRLDPTFAIAHGYAALCGGVRRVNRWGELNSNDIADIERLARRTWTLDQEDAVAIGCAAHALCLAVQDLDGATTYIERALALNSNYAPNWIYSGWINVFLGRHDVAIDHLSKAGRLSPFDWQNARIGVAMTAAHYFSNRYAEAYSWISKVLSDIEAPTVLRFGAASAAMAGRMDDAAKLKQRLEIADPGFRISSLNEVIGPYRNREHPGLYAEGLRRAGVPD